MSPYINQKLRERIDIELSPVLNKVPLLTIGELNYVITQILLATKPTNYTNYNALIGMLECVKQEFYRRVIAPYEDEKKVVEGDVFL